MCSNKIRMCSNNIHMEGSLSQFLHLGSSFYLMTKKTGKFFVIF